MFKRRNDREERRKKKKGFHDEKGEVNKNMEYTVYS